MFAFLRSIRNRWPSGIGLAGHPWFIGHGRVRRFGAGWIAAVLASALVMGQQPFLREVSLGREAGRSNPELLYVDTHQQLWIGTERGLYRHTENRAEPYPLPDGRERQVTVVADLPGRGLWVGYADGTVARLVNDRLQLWAPAEGRPRAPVTGISQDTSGQLWLSTYGEGLYCEAAGGRVYNFDETDGLPSREVYDLCPGPNGGVWSGTDAGLIGTSFVAGKKEVVVLGRSEGLPDEIVRSLAPATDGRLWVGTHQGGVVAFDPQEHRFTGSRPGWISGQVTDLYQFGPEEVLLLAEDGQLLRLSSLSEEPKIMLPGRYRALALGPAGNLRLLDRSGELHATDLGFGFPADQPSAVQSVLPRANGVIWYGTSEGIVAANKAGGQGFVSGSRGNNILCLAELNPPESPERLVLAGTFGQGILRCTATGCRTLGVAEGLDNPNVLALAVGPDTVFAATLGGVYAAARLGLYGGGGRWRRVQSLGSDFFYHAAVDNDGVLWLGSDGQGLLRYLDGSVTQFNQFPQRGDTLTVRSVLSVLPAAGGQVWINSQEHGLLQLTGERFAPPGVPLPLYRNDPISALAEGPEGELLVVHSDGIDVLHSSTAQWVRYGEQHGFDLAGDALNAVISAGDGSRWLVAGGRAVRYAPSTAVGARPAVELTRVMASGDTLLQFRPRLSQRANPLVFHFRGGWLTDPDAVTFRYRLSGQDRDWIRTTDDRATFAKLPPGAYVFELEAALNGQFDGADRVEYAFTVLAPWWQRWWALLGFVLAGGGLLYAYNRGRRRRRERIYQLEREKIRGELETIRAQINPHFLFNSFSTLLAIIEESPRSAVTYTEQLSAFYRRVLATRDRELVPLSEELELARNYAYLLEERYGDYLRVRMDIADETGSLPPFSLQVLVENAVKHNVVSSRYPLEVTIVRVDDRLVVSNPLQPRLRPVEGTGFGLAAIRRRYNLLGASRPITRTDAGTFTVELPIL